MTVTLHGLASASAERLVTSAVQRKSEEVREGNPAEPFAAFLSSKHDFAWGNRRAETKGEQPSSVEGADMSMEFGVAPGVDDNRVVEFERANGDVVRVPLHAEAFENSGVFGRALAEMIRVLREEKPGNAVRLPESSLRDDVHRPAKGALHMVGPLSTDLMQNGQGGRAPAHAPDSWSIMAPRSDNGTNTANETLRSDRTIPFLASRFSNLGGGIAPSEFSNLVETSADETSFLARLARAERVVIDEGRARSSAVRISLLPLGDGVKVVARVGRLSQPEQDSLKSEIKGMLARYGLSASEVIIEMDHGYPKDGLGGN